VKWYNAKKGFGFVIGDDGGEEYFVHRSAVADDVRLTEGARVEFGPAQSARGAAAVAVRPLNGQSAAAPVASAPVASTFAPLGLIEPLLRAVAEEGYTQPTAIQTQSIPYVLAGRDLLGAAQTGTGKTAAFALPILQRLALAARGNRSVARRVIRVLVLSPTRELATQIGESFAAYGRHTGFRQATVYGGVGQTPQVEALRAGVDILVATPGRLLDLLGQGHLRLDSVEMFVLDEADRMLDMGFIHDVKRVIALLPRERQTLLFSATMPAEIVALASAMLKDPVKVAVTPEQPTVEIIEQSVYFVDDKKHKQPLLEHLLGDRAITRALVFTRTKHGANKVVKQLERAGFSAEPIHGNKSQTARERALANFKSGRTRVLVATDVAARGIDIEEISHVIQFDLPNVAETYVHRIGRTGRAGAGGAALAFCDPEERPFLRDIEKLIRKRIPVVAHRPPAGPS
jgi:ATP-dependent RNA helicase RhlE